MSGISISKYYGLYQGLPAASGTLQVYQTGTTTPVTPYADAALVTPLSNPITLDGNGCCVFYYSGAVNLKLVAYTASGTLIETLDPVYPNGSGTSGSSATVPWVVAGGTSDIITATYNPVITSLSDGLLLSFRASAANTTTTPTFSPNGLTAYNITAYGGAALTPGNITANLAEYLVRYNLVNTRWELLNPTGVTTSVSNYQVTDSTDIALNALATATNIGSTQSMIIPTKGFILINFSGEIISATAANQVAFGLRIGSTNYWPSSTFSGSAAQQISYVGVGAETDIISSFGVQTAANTITGGMMTGLMIEASSIPTGVQTVQVIAAKNQSSPVCTLKGTVIKTIVNISMFNT